MSTHTGCKQYTNKLGNLLKNKGSDRKILPSKSQTSTTLQGPQSCYTQCEQYFYQTTILEVSTKTWRYLQNTRTMRRASLHVRNIISVENSPCIPRLTTRTILNESACEQLPMTPEEIDGDFEWKMEIIVKSEIISYERRVWGRVRTFEELRYFVKWRVCSEDENTWEPPRYLEHGKELVEDFHRENPDMPNLV